MIVSAMSRARTHSCSSATSVMISAPSVAGSVPKNLDRSTSAPLVSLTVTTFEGLGWWPSMAEVSDNVRHLLGEERTAG